MFNALTAYSYAKNILSKEQLSPMEAFLDNNFGTNLRGVVDPIKKSKKQLAKEAFLNSIKFKPGNETAEYWLSQLN